MARVRDREESRVVTKQSKGKEMSGLASAVLEMMGLERGHLKGSHVLPGIPWAQ